MQEKLTIAAPVRLMILSWVPLFGIYQLPSTLWAWLIKAVLVLFIISVIHASMAPMWDAYENMNAFVTMQLLWFAGILWLPDSFVALKYVCGFLIVLGLATMKSHVSTVNGKTRSC
jgi:hypothetical protein